jgi:hypothetical protein
MRSALLSAALASPWERGIAIETEEEMGSFVQADDPFSRLKQNHSQ